MAARTRNPVVKNPKRTIKSLSARVRKQKLSIIERMAEDSASHIQKLFGVSKNDVVGELIQTILLSDKKHPEPVDDVLTENGNRKTKKYIAYLWGYYGCKRKATKKPTTSRLSDLDDLVSGAPPPPNKKQTKPNKTRVKPTVDIYLSSQIINKYGEVTIRWESENASEVVYNNFGVKDPKKKTSGSIVVNNIKTKKTYKIVVANEFGDQASDQIDLELNDPDLDTLKNAIDDAKDTPSQTETNNQQPENKENTEEQDEPTIVSNKSRANLGGNQLNKTLEDIKKLTEDILTNLTNQSIFNKQVVEFDRKESEKQKRLKRENLMEKPKKLASQLMNSKIMAPIKSLFDWLINFIVFTLLGRTFKKVMDWATDPKNKNKVESIKRFLSDFWPALLATFILFGTGFGKFIRSTVGLIVKMSKFILGKGIPGLIKMFKNLGPKGKVAAAVIVGGIATKQIIGQLYKDRDGQPTDKKSAPSTSRRREQIEKNNKAPKLNVPAKRGGGSIKSLKNNPALSYLNSDNLNTSDLALDDSGLVTPDSGQKVRGAGKDTQLTALQPGEVVISKAAVEHFGGPDYFLKLNQMGGGTNQTKFANNIQLAAGGGLVGGGNVSNNQKFNNNVQIASGGFGNMLKNVGGVFGINSASPPKPKMAPPKKWHGPSPEYDHKSKEVRALLKTIKVAEGTIKSKNSYDTVYGGKMIPVRQMTVKELIDTQMTDKLPKRLGGGNAPWPKGSVASGAYQFMPHTLKELIKRKVLTPSDVMTPDTQDRAAWALANIRGITLERLKKEGLSRNILDVLSPEWASLPTKSGKSYYDQPVKAPSLLQKTYNQSLQLDQQANIQLQNKPKTNLAQLGNIPSPPKQSTPVLAANKIQKLPSSSPTIGPNNNLNTTTVINLPDVINTQQIGNNKGQGTSVPEFSAVSFAREERLDNVSTYGIA